MPYAAARKALKFNHRKIDGLIASHVHIDHFGRVSEYIKFGVNVYSSHEAFVHSGLSTSHRAKPLTEGVKTEIGEFTVLPFDLVHDVKNYGYLIHHEEMGLCCFITDTHYSPFVFPGLNNIIVESNYSAHLLEQRVESGSLHYKLAERVRQSHMADTTMVNFLKANDLSMVNNIVLIHLSSGNADALDMVQKVINATGRTPIIASKGMEIEFNKQSF